MSTQQFRGITKLRVVTLSVVTLSLATLSLSAPSLAAPQENGVTPELIVSLNRVTQASLDPTGQRVAYILSAARGADEDPGGTYAELWVVDLAGGEARRYTGRSSRASQPAWSSDGKRISFLSRRTDQNPNTQVYWLSVDGGEAVALTEHETSVSSYRWSPQGDRVAYVAGDPPTDEEKGDREAGRDWRVFDEGYKHRRLWVMDVGTGEKHKVYEEDLSTWSFSWAPDGESLVVQASVTPRIDDSYVFTRIYRVPAGGGSPTQVAETEGKLGTPTVSPDGARIAWLGAVSLNDPIAQSLFVAPSSGTAPRNLTEEFEGSGTSVQWLDEETVLLLAQEGTATTLNRVNLRTGERTVIATPGRILQSVQARPETGRFVAVGHSREHPSELYAGRLEGGEFSRVTRSNPQLDDVRLARQESIEWQGADGWCIEGVLTFPLDYVEGNRYPLVLQIHGGPEGVSLDGWTTSPTYPVQALAAAGYMVLQPNYRGSGGRGVAFSKADHDDLGGKEFEDVLAGIDALAERGLIDPDRVGTGGWSYGGYFSAWAATRHSERFKAAVVAAGLTNWVSFTGTTDIPYEMSLVHWNQWWFDNPELHWMRSPIAHVDKSRTATLIAHGTSDARVHPEQSLELYTALRIKGVPTELVFYPRQPHGLVERAHQLDFAQRVIAWFDQHLKE